MTVVAKPRLKHKSHVVSDGPDRAAARAMLRAVGLKDEDMYKPFIAVGSLASDVTPCNMHLDGLGAHVKQGVVDSGLVGMRFNTIGVSDGMSMGTVIACDIVIVSKRSTCAYSYSLLSDVTMCGSHHFSSL